MKGKLAITNREHGRFAVKIDGGNYAVFELQGGEELELGARVVGPFDSPGGTKLVIAGLGEASAHIDNCDCSREQAARWVAGH